MNKYTPLLAAALSLGLSSGLQAADLSVRAPVYKAPPPPVFTWSGFYLGVNGGWGFGQSRFTDGSGDTTGNFDIKGGLVGGTIGYNWQSGPLVWGLEGDIDWSDIHGSTNNACGGCRTSNQWLGTSRARLGYAVGNQWLAYATGGAAFGGIKQSASGDGSGTSTEAGWTAGGGLEWAFLPKWSAKAEYLYVRLSDADCATSICGGGGNVRFHTNIVRGGINYHF
jgi:outer membrane immunogenic protein